MFNSSFGSVTHDTGKRFGSKNDLWYISDEEVLTFLMHNENKFKADGDLTTNKSKLSVRMMNYLIGMQN